MQSKGLQAEKCCKKGVILQSADRGMACRGKVVQIGSPEELQRAPATPFVLHFIDDVNQMPASCQFVKRMGFRTEKPYVMCRPTVFDVSHSLHMSSCFLYYMAFIACPICSCLIFAPVCVSAF